MDEYRRKFHTFLGLHSSQVPLSTPEPIAYLGFAYDGTVPGPSSPLVALTMDDVCEELDTTSELVRWLLEQLRTYDCSCQRVIGLVFDRSTVLSEVLRVPKS